MYYRKENTNINQNYSCECGELCPRCDLIRSVLGEILACRTNEEAFETLHAFVDFIQECGYEEGIIDGTRTAGESLIESAKRLVDGDF